MALTIPTQFKFRPPNFIEPPKTLNNHIHMEVFSAKKGKKIIISRSLNTHHFCFHGHSVRNPMLCSTSKFLSVLAKACSDGGQREIFTAKTQSLASDADSLVDGSSNSPDGHIPLFIRMLGLDNDPRDREQAVVALWKYSLGGKQYIDNIMKYGGTINLIVNLLKSGSDSACEAAAGLLRGISSINMYRDLVAGSGAIEEISGLLRRTLLSSDVKEQSICTLWNLSVDEKFRVRIASSETLYVLLKFLEDEDVKVKEAAGGVLSNLTLSQSNHKIMVEAGVIPKLAKLLTGDAEESKVIRKEARNALLELAKDEYNRILLLEEGLVLVPLVGASAYRSFQPALYSWPSLPDGTEIDQSKRGPSRFGASELLLGLNVDKSLDLEEAKMNAIVGRTHQQFLARIGAIEIEDDNKSNNECSSSPRLTILPSVDAVARLVLILGLEDESAVARAAGAIADASINEHMRISFKVSGALRHLVQLISHPSDDVRFSVIRALERLSVSNSVCQTIEAEGVLHPLIYFLKRLKSETSHHTLTGMILDILTRILDPNKELKSRFTDGPVNGSRKGRVEANETDVISSELTSSMQTIDGDLVDSAFLSCLVDILKIPNAGLQRKAASILEFIIVVEPCLEKIISAGIEPGLEAVFQQKSLAAMEYSTEGEAPEVIILELEEAGLAVSAASRLLTKLLDYDQFRKTVDSSNFTKLLREILVSSIPIHLKDWVAACLVKLGSFSSQNLGFEDPINMEVTLYEIIPRLLEKIESPFPPEVQESAVLELNRIISEGLLDSTKAVASQGGIFPLVKVMENGSDRAAEASLAILYNLSMDGENHAAILAAGTVPVLRKIVLSERPYWMRALRLLRTLPT